MEQKKRSAKIWMCIAIVGLLVSMVGASLVQTGGGRVDMRHIVFETPHGHISGWLLVPEGVSAANPAPGIVATHGMFNNRAMQDLNFVELSRRGFVVFAMDMFSHGDSAHVFATPIITGQSMNQAVQMMSRLGYVDPARIGITGHSLGGMSSNEAIRHDNLRETPLIAAVLINSANAIWGVAPNPAYPDTSPFDIMSVPRANPEFEFYNIYRNRHIGILAPQYEEFFMLDWAPDGGRTSPVDFIRHDYAQSFLHFGQDPAGLQTRAAETIYRNEAGAIRVIYNPAIIHPWAHFSQQATYGTIEFFQEALGAPTPISPSDQVWQWKVVFNTLGLIAIFIFLVNFVTLMLFTKNFESLRAKDVVEPHKTDMQGKIWYFIMTLAGAAFATLTYLPILARMDGHRHTAASALHEGLSARMTGPAAIGMWALANAGFGLLLMAAYYFAHGRKSGFSFKNRGIAMPILNLGKTIVLAALSLTVFFGILFFADFFFMVDFRIWTIALRPFESGILLYALVPYMLFMTAFFVVNSLSATSFNYNDVGGKKWVNMLLFSLINTLPAIILLSIQYFTFFNTGFLFFGDHAAGAQGPYQMFVIWLFPFLVILSVTPIISRKIYRLTNNPYLPGILNGVIITMMAVANTLTWAA